MLRQHDAAIPFWRSHMSSRRLFAFLFFLIVGIAGVGNAQTFRGGISGRVSDSTGGVLPGVTVVATLNATGLSRTTTSSAGGDFSMTHLPLGTYTVEANLQGFQTLKVTVQG